MNEKKEPHPFSRKSRVYASLIFLIAFAIIAVIWIIIFSSALQPSENLITLLILFLVFGGLAVLPWLPVFFPREPQGGVPYEDL
ncbi:MAG: hypothetical protein ACFFBR_06535 [Promethearchaeota archaeon]